ncbi:MAG: phytanoyl-CoA dioxygenase family protein, partial [Akkermansiaceae bacterium]|nr:phytanoyl-CoA dioxygenase family protein [Akkermansiaceae bacterium]
TPEDVAFLREIYDRLFAERRGREEGNQFDLAGTDEEGKEA